MGLSSRSGIAADQHASDSLTESEARFRLLADTAPVMVWISGPDKLCTFFNKPWLNFTGRTMEQELGNGWSEGVHPDDFARCLDTYQTAFDTRRDFTMEYRLRRADGVYRWILDNGVPHHTPEGGFAGYIGSCIDITERKEAEEALRESEERYRAYFDLNTVGAGEVDLSDGRFLRVNDAYCQMLGYSRDELLGLRFADISHPDELEQNLRLFAQLFRGEIPHHRMEKRYIRKDGSSIWVQLDITLIRDGAGNPASELALVIDITDRKEMEAALRDSEARNRAFFELNAVGASETRLSDGRCLRVNDALCAMTGYTRDELLSMRIGELTHPEDREKSLEDFRRLARGEWQSYESEKRSVRKDGSIIWLHIDVSLVRHDEAPAYAIAIIQDITDRRWAEEALRESEERYRAYFDLNAVGAGEVDLSEGRFLRVNDALCQITGYSPDELLGMRFVDVTHPDDREKDWRQFARLIRGEIPHYRMEKRYIRKDGSSIWVQLAVTLIKDGAGNPVSELGLTLDITERKEGERNLQQLATRLLQSQDEERRRIAQELHDETAQTIFAINLNLNHLLRSQPALDDQAKSLVDETLGMGEHVLKEIRTLSYLLHPPLLDQVGLESAVEWYVDGFIKRSGIDVKLEMPPPEIGRLPADVETALFRIVQESLTNIHRHSGSERASIRLAKEAGRIILEVKDQGSGMAAETSESNEDVRFLGIGISGMRQRVHQLGGQLDISSAQTGTTVTAVVPLEGEISRD